MLWRGWGFGLVGDKGVCGMEGGEKGGEGGRLGLRSLVGLRRNRRMSTQRWLDGWAINGLAPLLL